MSTRPRYNDTGSIVLRFPTWIENAAPDASPGGYCEYSIDGKHLKPQHRKLAEKMAALMIEWLKSDEGEGA